ncbi:MAG: MipA/OmpV family protein [Pseudomonadota bacterium]
MRYQAATLIICASLGLFGVRADAQTTQEPPQVVGVGIAVLPEFEGSDRYQVVPFPIANIGVGGNRLDVSGLSAKVDLLEISTFRLGPSAGLQFARDDNAEDSRIALLDPVDFSIEPAS